MAGPLKILISYRREDSAAYAGRLYDDLTDTFGRGSVFIDIDAIEPGVDFTEVIAREVGSADVVLVMIGRRWVSIEDGQGRRRLDNPGDYHRLEVEAALERNIRVIPVLVQDAPMPHMEDLPESIGRLAHRNALEMSDKRWTYDLGLLVGALQRIGASQAPAEPEAEEEPEAAPGVPRDHAAAPPAPQPPAPAATGIQPPPRPDLTPPPQRVHYPGSGGRPAAASGGVRLAGLLTLLGAALMGFSLLFDWHDYDPGYELSGMRLVAPAAAITFFGGLAEAIRRRTSTWLEVLLFVVGGSVSGFVAYHLIDEEELWAEWQLGAWMVVLGGLLLGAGVVARRLARLRASASA